MLSVLGNSLSVDKEEFDRACAWLRTVVAQFNLHVSCPVSMPPSTCLALSTAREFVMETARGIRRHT
jgi:hypothetical protein